MNDLKFALRQLARNPGFAAVAVLTLALGIGANTAIFSVLHSVVIRPFSYPDSDRITFIRVADTREQNSFNSFSYPDFLDYQAQAQSRGGAFEQFAGAMDGNLAVSGIAEPTRVKAGYVSPEVFPLLRTAPLLGRALTTADNHRNAELACVLNHTAWVRFFAGAQDIIGRTIELDSRPHTIVGVMPPSFKFWDAQVYIPLIHGIPIPIENARGAQNGLWGVGRLSPNATLEQANAELATIAARIRAAHPETPTNAVARAERLADTVSGQIRPTLQLLLGAVGFVLLIACVNVANLLLARGAAREREIAVRSALGADHRRIFRQLLLETLPLALAGGVLGILLAAGGLKVILNVMPKEFIPAEATIRLSLPVLGFSLTLSLLSALLAGVLPALQTARVGRTDALKGGTRTSGDRRASRVRNSLVVAEVALALTLLIGAGLLLKHLNQLLKVDPGFQTEGLLVARIGLPEARYQEPARSTLFVNELLQRSRAIPGVTQAATAQSAPFGSSGFGLPLLISGISYTRPDDLRGIQYNAVSDNALTTLGARLLSGRNFTPQDREGSERVVILNAAAAQRFFPGSNPIGRKVTPGVPANLADANNLPREIVSPPWATVIGVVSDMRQFGFAVDAQPEAFIPYDQSFTLPMVRNQFHILVRTSSSAETTRPALRALLKDLDPTLPVDTIQSMTTMTTDSVRPQRFVALLLGIFAGVACLLAALGIYSVVAWGVAQRTQEVGIRLALGATPACVVSALVRQALQPIGIGIVVGLSITLVLTRLLSTQLANIPTQDTLTYATVALLLAAIATLACWIPSRRAARVDPIQALRSE